jgi:ornithine carbamoyltransferase
MKDFLRTADLSPTDLELLLRIAEDFKARPHHRPGTLRDETVVLYFAKPSTRTRLSFETAVTRLGGVPVSVGPDELQLGRGETIEDTARVISRFAAAMAIRTFADDDVRRLAAAATIPVINALTDGHHPCQSLADLLTLREHFGRLAGVRVAYVGDGNNVAHSLLEACAIAGVDIEVATPVGFEPDSEVVRRAERLAKHSAVLVTNDPLQAVAGADAVYTDVWLSMGDPEEQRNARRQTFESYRITPAVMAEADERAVFLHCLPAHRGEEVSAAVIDGPQSLVFDQAENRLHTEMAVLYALRRGMLEGRVEGATLGELAGAAR